MMNNTELSWIISIVSFISLSLPILLFLYFNYYDDITNWLLFRNHEREVISNYQNIIKEMEVSSKKHD